MRRLAYLALIASSAVAGLAGWLAGSEHGLQTAVRLAGTATGGRLMPRSWRRWEMLMAGIRESVRFGKDFSFPERCVLALSSADHPCTARLGAILH
jgi:hypothetical protein